MLQIAQALEPNRAALITWSKHNKHSKRGVVALVDVLKYTSAAPQEVLYYGEILCRTLHVKQGEKGLNSEPVLYGAPPTRLKDALYIKHCIIKTLCM